MLVDFFNLIYPRLCSACSQPLLKNEELLCIKCQYSLPKTNFHNHKENDVSKLFWGRIPIETAAAYYRFSKKSKVQHLLHQLKYKDNKEIGRLVGKLYGYELKTSPHFQEIDVIIPVPLHPKKLKIRGYNQSEWIAKGLSESMKTPLNNTDLYRTEHSQSQTKKGRYNRWENVGSIFAVKNENELKGKSIMLVDDVITTGATIEACATPLQQLGCKIYIVALAATIL